jgi:starvation-inducible DNA-binding protein
MAKESKKMKSEGLPSFTIPGMTLEQGAEVAALLQDRLNALTDLHLTLKHVHWNVVGPHFVSVHEMADTTAERISTLGLSPIGTPGALVADRSWNDYSIGRAGAIEHLGALDLVYVGVIEDYRRDIAATEELDPVTQDMLIGQAGQLEQFHWFVRAHLETSGGALSTAGASSEVQARGQARAGVKRKTA